MTKQTEALEMAIELTERFLEHDSISSSDYIDVRNACIKALEPTVAELNDEYLRDTHVEGLNHPTQEPVLYIDGGGLDGHATWAQAIRCQDTDIALYTHPKQWQGLSDKELFNLSQQCDLNHILGLIDYGRAIEAKLREKNT
jgi:hypothetical protein